MPYCPPSMKCPNDAREEEKHSIALEGQATAGSWSVDRGRKGEISGRPCRTAAVARPGVRRLSWTRVVEVLHGSEAKSHRVFGSRADLHRVRNGSSSSRHPTTAATQAR